MSLSVARKTPKYSRSYCHFHAAEVETRFALILTPLLRMAATTPLYSAVGLKQPEVAIAYSDIKHPFQICSGAKPSPNAEVIFGFNI